MPQAARRRLFDAAMTVAALVMVALGLLGWRHGGPEVEGYAVMTLCLVAAVALMAGIFLQATSVRGAAPVIAGVALAVLSTGHVEEKVGVFPLWALGVLAAYTALLRSPGAGVPRGAVVVVAGQVMMLVAPLLDLGLPPYDRLMGGLAAYFVAFRLLERLRFLLGGTSAALTRRVALLMVLGQLYTAGLDAMVVSLDEASTRPWRAATISTGVVLGGLAVVLAARIRTLRRVANALTEAAATTPWPRQQIDEVLQRLVSGNVRADSLTIEQGPGPAGTISEQITPGSYLVARREPGDFGFSHHDARLVAGLAAMARASHIQQAREHALWTETVTDQLTGLWSYNHWRAELRDQCLGRQGGERIGVVFLDLDRFKQVNSDYGHLQADNVLATVGLRLLGQAPTWQFGRFGGDEFVGIVRHVHNREHLDTLCRALAAAIAEPIQTDGQTISVETSVGRALSESVTDNPELVLAHAEQDLRERKRSRDIRQAISTEELVQGLLREGLDVAYQPLIDAHTWQVLGWEALVRGSLPEIGALNPGVVIDSATRTGALDVVTHRVADQAIATVAEASRRLGSRMTVSVNVELDQVHDGELVDWLVEQARTEPVHLLLEVTENTDSDRWTAAHDLAAAKLESAGIGLVLDDLGSGNYRTSLLARRHWEAVKLDREFLLLGERGEVMLHHTVQMLHGLGLTTVLEGIETAAQARLAQRFGISLVQGFFFCRPVLAEQMLAMVSAHGVDLPRAAS
ncbi:EAL domain-containing protein [Nocardioides sp.]|uniref:EAL domain-containing protein n=1 Tax=Nocardioides sp. TaxID=35761 RepID=UPI0039E5F6B9